MASRRAAPIQGRHTFHEGERMATIAHCIRHPRYWLASCPDCRVAHKAQR